MNRKSYSLKKPSNRARMRAANAAIKYAAQLEQMLRVGAENSNGLQATICALLAQKGGEITISPGTIQQLSEVAMHFVIVPGPGENEVTLRLIPDMTAEEIAAGKMSKGEVDAIENDDDDRSGSEAVAEAEDKAAYEAEVIRGASDAIQSAGSGDGGSEG